MGRRDTEMVNVIDYETNKTRDTHDIVDDTGTSRIFLAPRYLREVAVGTFTPPDMSAELWKVVPDEALYNVARVVV